MMTCSCGLQACTGILAKSWNAPLALDSTCVKEGHEDQADTVSVSLPCTYNGIDKNTEYHVWPMQHLCFLVPTVHVPISKCIQDNRFLKYESAFHLL